MSHARTQIRTAIVVALAGIMAFDGRVWGCRTAPHDAVPDATVVITRDEVDDGHASFDSDQTRVLTIEIELRAAVTGRVDDRLDDLCAAVETAMQRDPSFGGLLQHLILAETDISRDGATGTMTGRAVLTYEAWYAVNAADPETILTHS